MLNRVELLVAACEPGPKLLRQIFGFCSHCGYSDLLIASQRAAASVGDTLPGHEKLQVAILGIEPCGVEVVAEHLRGPRGR